MALPIKPLKSEVLARALPIATALIAIAYALVAYAFLFMPKLGRAVAGGDLDLAPLQQRVADVSDYKTKLTAMQQQYAATNPALRTRVQNMVPSATETQSLYVLLDEICTKYGAVLTSVDTTVDPGTLSDRGLFETRGSANIAGVDYERFKRLVAEFERSERVIDVESLVFGSNATTFTMVFRAYGFDERRLRQAPVEVPVPVAEQPL